MKEVRPRSLTHRGVVQAAAFFIDASLIGAVEARRRILALWVPGAAVYREPRGWLIRLPGPRRVRTDQAPGLPLTAENTARDFNLRYFPVSSFEELEAALPVFFAAESGASILEVFTDSKTNAAFFEQYRAAVKAAFA